MSSFPEKLENFNIELDEKRILRLIGYKKKTAKKENSVKEIISKEQKRLDYEETNKHPIFKDAEKVAFCICTIGPGMEVEVTRLMKENELLRSLILDTLGSEAVEEVAIQSDKRIALKAKEMGFWPSKRFSPEYKNWRLEEQQFIFRILHANKIGVHLLKDSWMMIPRKSVSFRINFYK